MFEQYMAQKREDELRRSQAATPSITVESTEADSTVCDQASEKQKNEKDEDIVSIEIEEAKSIDIKSEQHETSEARVTSLMPPVVSEPVVQMDS